MKENLNYLICNLIGAIEVLEIAYLKGDTKSTMKALVKVTDLKDALKKREHFDRDSGHDVWYD